MRAYLYRVGITAMGVGVGLSAFAGCSSTPTENVGTTTSVTQEQLTPINGSRMVAFMPLRQAGEPSILPDSPRANPLVINTANANDVTYYGGPLIGAGKVYNVYWGSSAQAGNASTLQSFIQDVGASEYFGQLISSTAPTGTPSRTQPSGAPWWTRARRAGPPSTIPPCRRRSSASSPAGSSRCPPTTRST